MSVNVKPIRPNKAYGDAKAIADLSRGMKPMAGTDALKPARGEGRPRASTPAASAQPVPQLPPEHIDLIRNEAIARKYAMQAAEILDDPSEGETSKAFARAIINRHQQASLELKDSTPNF